MCSWKRCATSTRPTSHAAETPSTSSTTAHATRHGKTAPMTRPSDCSNRCVPYMVRTCLTPITSRSNTAVTQMISSSLIFVGTKIIEKKHKILRVKKFLSSNYYGKKKGGERPGGEGWGSLPPFFFPPEKSGRRNHL